MLDWRPIETAPKNGDEVLLFYPGHSTCEFAVGWWLTFLAPGHWHVIADTDGEYCGSTPTHWAPLAGPST